MGAPGHGGPSWGCNTVAVAARGRRGCWRCSSGTA
nr:MAG: hypothetical protein [Molluscum contagiosum virus]WQH58168.1 MAG: hypothetical protein [Molluscum contagiosum virus]